MRIAAPARAILQSWKVRTALVVGGAVALGAAVLAMNSAWDNAASAWQKVELFYAYAATPWVGVMALAIIGGLMYFGVREVAKAQALGLRLDEERDRTDALARREELRDAVQFNRLLALAFLAQKKSQILSEFLSSLERGIVEYESRIKGLESAPSVHPHTGIELIFLDAIQKIHFPLDEVNRRFGLTLDPRADIDAFPVTEPPDQDGGHFRTFDPARPQNRLWLHQHRGNLASLKVATHRLKTMVEEAAAASRRFEAEASIEAARLTNG